MRRYYKRQIGQFLVNWKNKDVKYGIKFGDKNIGFNNKLYTLPYFTMFLLKELT